MPAWKKPSCFEYRHNEVNQTDSHTEGAQFKSLSDPIRKEL